jgi:UDP-3-O-acyl-N-acetylglucosamine deacetylase
MILASLYGLDIDNVLIKINSEEMPVFDSSAIEFANAINKVGLKKQDVEKKVKSVSQVVISNDNKIVAMPFDTLDFTVLLKYGSSVLGSQFANYSSETNFIKEYAPARSFVFLSELIILIEIDYLKTNLYNTIIFVDRDISKDIEMKLLDFLEIKKSELRISHYGNITTKKLYFENEPSRHKALSILSLLALFGGKVLGKFYISNLSKSDNIVFFKKLYLDHMTKEYQYDIALSFAGENREYVEEVAKILKKRKISVFYDKYEQANLWGKDLYQHLNEVYKNKSRLCIVFISKSYSEKLWTNHELRSAQERAFKENSEYILPVRFDESTIPGINSTTGYLDISNMNEKELAKEIVKKLRLLN